MATGISETPSPTTASEDRLRPIPTGWEWLLIVAGALVAESSSVAVAVTVKEPGLVYVYESASGEAVPAGSFTVALPSP